MQGPANPTNKWYQSSLRRHDPDQVRPENEFEKGYDLSPELLQDTPWIMGQMYAKINSTLLGEIFLDFSPRLQEDFIL